MIQEILEVSLTRLLAVKVGGILVAVYGRYLVVPCILCFGGCASYGFIMYRMADENLADYFLLIQTCFAGLSLTLILIPMFALCGKWKQTKQLQNLRQIYAFEELTFLGRLAPLLGMHRSQKSSAK